MNFYYLVYLQHTSIPRFISIKKSVWIKKEITWEREINVDCFSVRNRFLYVHIYVYYCKLTFGFRLLFRPITSGLHCFIPISTMDVYHFPLSGERIMLDVGVFLETCGGGERCERNRFHSENSPPHIDTPRTNRWYGSRIKCMRGVF